MNVNVWKQKKKELKLTFDSLSKMSNVPKRTLEDIFSGRTPTPRIDTVKAIEKALGIGENNFVKENEQGITDDEKEILNKVRKVLNKHGDQGKNLILNYFDRLLNN